MLEGRALHTKKVISKNIHKTSRIPTLRNNFTFSTASGSGKGQRSSMITALMADVSTGWSGAGVLSMAVVAASADLVSDGGAGVGVGGGGEASFASFASLNNLCTLLILDAPPNECPINTILVASISENISDTSCGTCEPSFDELEVVKRL
jgi:hypothetical protein